MRGRSRFLGGMAGVFLSVIAARSQTAVWTGGGGANTNFSNGANWMGGTPPPNDGSHTLDLNEATNATISVNGPGNVAGIVFGGAPGDFSQYVLNDAGGALTIGSGGISIGALSGANLYFNANLVLSQNQTWDIGFVNQEGGVISGSGALSTTGSAFMFGDNTFTGGVNVLSGIFYVGSGASAGTGTLTLSDNVSLDTFFSADTLANAVVIGDNDTIGTAVATPLTLTGPVTFTDATTNLIIGSNSIFTLAGAVGGPFITDLTLQGAAGSPILPADGGSQVILQGTLNQVSDITASGTQLILAPSGNPTTSFSSLTSSGVHIGVMDFTWGYLGFDGTFATTGGAVAGFLTAHGSIGSTISGTLGFDTTATPQSPQTFSDPIDLSTFTSTSFLGLGSATSAILSGTITPTPLFLSSYVFGGGGGTLTVTSDLNDVADTSLVMTNAPAPLTLILQGANNYLGSVMSNGGVLIFDSSVLPGAGLVNLNGGYVGSTETPGLTSAQFIALFDTVGQGVIGFDQHAPNPGSPRQVGDAIDLSGFNFSSTVFLGTATALELLPSAVITPANHQYMFTGVKGGILTIDTQLTDATSPPASNSLTLGLINPIESNGSTSVVNITGDNTFSGGTTFNSGTVFINSNTAFGTGAILIPDTPGANISPYLASYGGAPVTITNPISVGSRGGSQGVSLGNVSPSGADMLVLNGIISDESSPFSLPGLVGISGPVTLGAVNTYSGGTIFSGIGNAEALVTNSSSLGSGPITIQDGATIAPLGASVALDNPINLVGNSPLNLGLGGNTFILTLNGIISGNGTVNIDSSVALNGANSYSGSTVIQGADVVIGASDPTPFGSSAVTLNAGSSLEYAANPTILDLSGDSTSSVNLGSGQVITLDADANGGVFDGAITGDATNSLVKIDSGLQQLTGTSTYGGGTTVSAGVLIAGSSGSLGTGTVTVASGATLGTQSGAVITNSINLGGNATLSGSGTFAPVAPIFFGAGDTVMPGNPINGQWVSTLSFGTPVTFAVGGIYTLDVSDASGVAGVGYSTIDVAGTLTITAPPGSFTIGINSISPGGGPGLATFNPMQAYSWTILTAGTINLFNANEFTLNTTNFQNPLAGGSFAIAQSGNTLTLDFTPVPEPSTWMLMLTGLATVGAGVRRRRRR